MSRNIPFTFDYYGGKKAIAEELIAKFAENKRIYCEPYFGSGATFFALKQKYDRYILNDKDEDIVNFLRVLISEDGDELIKQLISLEPEEWEFRRAKVYEKEIYRGCSALERAVFTYINISQSFNNTRKSFRKGMDAEVYQKRIANGLPLAQQRLRDVNVEIHNTDALELIRQYKGDSNVQMILDPPYMWDKRTTEVGYNNEMDSLAHIDLLNELRDERMKASAVLCGYHSPFDDLYDTFLPTWKSELLKEVPKPSGNSSGKAGARAEEWVWVRY